MQLPDAWYVVASSDEIGKKPVAVDLFSQKFVLWRDSTGTVVMQSDVCPHRSASLSLGEVINNCITCPFHGFVFDTNGLCSFIPETGRPAPNLKLETFNTVERHGFVWLKRGENLPESPPWFDQLNEKLVSYQSIHEWPTHISRCVENQLDYAHLPFVHKRTIGHSVNVLGPRRIDCDEREIKMYVDAENSDIPTIRFIFPNLWLLTIKPEKFFQFIAFVPVAPGVTRLYLRAYQGFFTVPGLASLLGPVFNFSNSIILSEDRQVVLSQRPLDSSTTSDEKLFPSDRAIKFFRELWRLNT
ncbi:aromatic ring-hydroxylating dioxygenase subunit alpha [Candidatus Obscuribacterales bacterium]|nr:aromatic ring-hydroxylating dioxygenase subunit alpha [Candidatus Obscuribacterales bacterium]MBX3136833.1 aromatic ring-hydroxylating dioxygenase subunit alpha [Candidatus Obscuribacterales bacterium]MBX3151403.1 aromatic ring-hydroxylating dioxygenase subunit alpha [Candidatus Obscuribacterales bacterium]